MAVVCPVPRRAGVAGLEASFATRLPVAGYTRGAVASGAPGVSRCWGLGRHTLRWCRLGCGVHRLRGCRGVAPAWSGWLGRRYRRGTAPATGYRHRVTRWWVVPVGPAVFSCFCEAVTRCFAKLFRLYARLSDFRQAVGVIGLSRCFNASDGLVAGAVGVPHGVCPHPGFQTAG